MMYWTAEYAGAFAIKYAWYQIFHWLNIGQFILILIKPSSRGVISSFDKYAFHIIWSYEKYKLIMFFTFTSIYNTYNYCWSFHMLEVILQELKKFMY